jgi:hypothetical protein
VVQKDKEVAYKTHLSNLQQICKKGVIHLLHNTTTHHSGLQCKYVRLKRPSSSSNSMSKLLNLLVEPNKPLRYTSSGGLLQTAAFPDSPAAGTHAILKMREIVEGASTEAIPATICELREGKVGIRNFVDVSNITAHLRSILFPSILPYRVILYWSSV